MGRGSFGLRSRRAEDHGVVDRRDGKNLERAKGLEPSTPTLARALRVENEPVGSTTCDASMAFADTDYRQLLAAREITTRVQTAGSVLLGRMQRAVELSKSPDAVAAQKLKELAGG